MKFINNGDKHSEYGYLDDNLPSYDETARPRYTPSYYNISKKMQDTKKSRNEKMQ